MNDIHMFIVAFSEIVHEDFAAAEIVNALEDVHLRATKQHGKQKHKFFFPFLARLFSCLFTV